MDEETHDETRTGNAEDDCSIVPANTSTSNECRSTAVVRKTSRQQRCEGREHNVDSLFNMLRSRKRSGKAAWWNLLHAVKESVEEEVDLDKTRYEKVYLRCTECNRRHPEQDNGVLAPVRFASSHFAD
jgi:hypothetical protein